MIASLALNFSRRDDKTVLRVLRQDPPWRSVRAFHNASGEAFLHLHNVSGGILGGDGLRLEVLVEPAAQAQITAVGATRVYRRRANQPTARQVMRVIVGEDAFLELLPEPVIPFADSSFEQQTQIELAKGAGLIWWETLAAGRIAKGECFAFESLSAETTLSAMGVPLARERYSLIPRCQPMSSPVRFGNFLYSTTMYVCRVGVESARWLALERELNELAQSLPPGAAKWGASTLPSDGVVVRGMAQSAPAISAGLQAMWQTAKNRVWGKPAILPRKIH